MKKLLCIFSLLLLVGCTNASTIKPVTRNLTFTAELTYYNEFYEISGEINQNGKMTLKILQPDDLKDITFTVTNGNIKADFKGLSYNLNSPNQTNAISFIYNAFKDEAPKVYENNNEFFIKGQFDNFEYKMFIGQSGLPLEIIDSSGRFNVIFKNPGIKKE